MQENEQAKKLEEVEEGDAVEKITEVAEVMLKVLRQDLTVALAMDNHDCVNLKSSDDEVSTLDPDHYDPAAFQSYPTSIGDGRQHSLMSYLSHDVSDFAQCEFLDASHLIQFIINEHENDNQNV